MNEDLVDRDLAARLAPLIPDVADDGFTRSVMTSLPSRKPVTAVRSSRLARLQPLLLAAAGVLAFGLIFILAGGEFVDPTPVAEQAFPAAGAFGPASVSVLLESHLYTIVAAAICAATLLIPQILEE